MGKLDELDTSTEEFNLYLLAKMPENKKLTKFIKERLLSKQHADNYKLQIIEPKDGDAAAKKLKAILDHV